MSGLDRGVVAALEEIVGAEHVKTGRSARYNRTRVSAPFPVHRWADFAPDAVVLPGSRDEVVEIVKVANRAKVPLVPRAGGTGLADGAVPLRRGIVVDVKRLDQLVDVDLVNHTATVQPGLSLLRMNQALRKHGVFYSDAPTSYPCAMIGGRAGTSGLSRLGLRYGHTRDNIISLEVVLPTGAVARIGDGGVSPLIRKSSTGLNLKNLFIGHQGTLGITTELTIDLTPLPEVECPLVFAFESDEAVHAATLAVGRGGPATLASLYVVAESKVQVARRDDPGMIEQPPEVRALLATVLYGSAAEIAVGKEIVLELGAAAGGRYLGDEVSEEHWGARHDGSSQSLHGRAPNGQVVPMCWHCEDAAVPYSEVPALAEKWTAIVDRYVADYDVFDNWGLIYGANAAYRPWGEYLVEQDVGIREQALDDDSWGAFVSLQSELATVTLEHGGSMTACHGSTRDGMAQLVPQEVGPEGFRIMNAIKDLLDPNNIMNPGKSGIGGAGAPHAR